MTSPILSSPLNRSLADTLYFSDLSIIYGLMLWYNIISLSVSHLISTIETFIYWLSCFGKNLWTHRKTEICILFTDELPGLSGVLVLRYLALAAPLLHWEFQIRQPGLSSALSSPAWPEISSLSSRCERGDQLQLGLGRDWLELTECFENFTNCWDLRGTVELYILKIWGS